MLPPPYHRPPYHRPTPPTAASPLTCQRRFQSPAPRHHLRRFSYQLLPPRVPHPCCPRAQPWAVRGAGQQQAAYARVACLTGGLRNQKKKHQISCILVSISDLMHPLGIPCSTECTTSSAGQPKTSRGHSTCRDGNGSRVSCAWRARTAKERHVERHSCKHSRSYSWVLLCWGPTLLTGSTIPPIMQDMNIYTCMYIRGMPHSPICDAMHTPSKYLLSCDDAPSCQ